MEIRKLHLVYFSPTGTTKSVLHAIAGFLNTETAEHDVTDYARKDTQLEFGPEDIVIFGFPVYGGRVPQTFIDRLSNIKGDSTVAVLIATYGNRGYEDALLEMKDVAVQNGFRAIGAAAVVTEHSVIRSIAAGRPDPKDMAFLKDFCIKLKEKTAAIIPKEKLAELKVPGKKPYVKRIKLPMTPIVSASCIACGLCAKACPAGAISVQNPKKTDKEKCIGCMRCLRVCPKKARHVLKIKMIAGKWILCTAFKADKVRKEPEIFL